MKFARMLIIVLPAIAFTACSSIPFGTMWKMARFGPDDLARVDPSEIRAAVQSDEVFVDLIVEPRLAVKLTAPGMAEVVHAYSLSDATAAEVGRLSESPAGRSWRVYTLDESEYPAFRDMQEDLYRRYEGDELDDTDVAINLEFGSSDRSGQADPDRSESEKTAAQEAVRRWAENGLPVTIRLQLFQQEGYFTLVDEARLDISVDEPENNAESDL